MYSVSTGKAANGQSGRWYVVQARPGREALALRHLQNQHFVSFCPKRLRIRQVGRHKVPSLAPWFPGYIFVKIDTERQRWRSISGTIGVVRLVGFGNREGRPAPLPEGLVERFQELSAENGELRFSERLASGDRVRIMGGPFDGLCGVLDSVDDVERVTILLGIVSKEARVRLRRDMLIAA